MGFVHSSQTMSTGQVGGFGSVVEGVDVPEVITVTVVSGVGVPVRTVTVTVGSMIGQSYSGIH